MGWETNCKVDLVVQSMQHGRYSCDFKRLMSGRLTRGSKQLGPEETRHAIAFAIPVGDWLTAALSSQSSTGSFGKALGPKTKPSS